MVVEMTRNINNKSEKKKLKVQFERGQKTGKSIKLHRISMKNIKIGSKNFFFLFVCILKHCTYAIMLYLVINNLSSFFLTKEKRNKKIYNGNKKKSKKGEMKRVANVGFGK